MNLFSLNLAEYYQISLFCYIMLLSYSEDIQMEEENKIPINKETMDILVTNVIPTTKYFETRFDHLQYQIDEIKDSQKKMQRDMDNRFNKVDERFNKVDERFDKVNENISNLALKIEQLTKSQETTIRDYIIERDRFYDKKFNNLRMFNIATISVVSGILLKMLGILNI